MNDLLKSMDCAAARFPHVKAIKNAETRGERLNAIRRFYVKAWEEIREEHAWRWAIDPYEVDWTLLFTPIEYALWHDIRSEGMVLYPQFPVAGYFVDFGNPKARVAIECDGAAFHVDEERDARRQAAIEAKGWTVYRFTGSECFQDFREYYDENGCPRIEVPETRRRMREIARRHGISPKHLGWRQ